jgi:hypothetical protein
MQTQRLLALVLLSALFGACKQTDDPNDSAATETSTDSSTGATDPTTSATASDDSTGATSTGAGCDATACSEMCAGNHDEPCHTPYAGVCQDDECVCEKQPDDCVVLMVECGEVTCAQGQICVQPGEDCDYNMDPPQFFTPPPFCADPPPECVEGSDGEEGSCLGVKFCEGDGIGGAATYADGQLTCPPRALDCF